MMKSVEFSMFAFLVMVAFKIIVEMILVVMDLNRFVLCVE